MSIKLPHDLPARKALQEEGIEVVETGLTRPRQANPLRVGLLNLMPQKALTETQVARLLGNTPHEVALTLIVPDSYTAKSTPPTHMAAYYEPWSRVRDQRFDGLVITGAPVETLPFEKVTYWQDLTRILDWARRHVSSTYCVCWAAQAALRHFHGVPKRRLERKAFGVFQQRVVAPDHPLLQGFDAEFPVPVSRRAEVRRADLPDGGGLKVLADSRDSGLCLIEDTGNAAYYMFDHLEYDTETLRREYIRDREAARPVHLPRNYFPHDDPAQRPVNGWSPYAHLLFRNWLDQLARAPRSEAANALDSLLAARRWPSVAREPFTDLLIWGSDGLDTLPRALGVLADLALSPRAVKVDRHGGARMRIDLRLDGVDPAMAETVARSLLGALEDVSRVTYRSSDGSGGVLVNAGADLNSGVAEEIGGDLAVRSRLTAA